MSSVKTFEPNLVGRDFVIGDLHGAMDCLSNLLEKLYFDIEKDRLFSVADLVDRGNKSLEALDLLHEPWFHAVRANHEEMFIDTFSGDFPAQLWFLNGGSWAMEAVNDWAAHKQRSSNGLGRTPSEDSLKVYDAIPILKSLPYIITVKLTNGERVHILHAELPRGYKFTDEDLANPEIVDEIAKYQAHDGPMILWGRDIFLSFYDYDLTNEDKVARKVKFEVPLDPNPELSHVISGHTIVRRPLTIHKYTNLDTRAFGTCREEPRVSDALTCLELNTWTFYQATPTSFRRVEPLVINSDRLNALATE